MANLAQLRILEELNGFLPVDKPAGIAFSTVVKTVKRKFNLVKVGHGGSLDAMASGLLVLLVNDANRFAGDVMGADRAWEGTMRLGEKTDTCDVHGNRAGGDPAVAAALDGDAVSRALGEFKGDVFQTEPRFCSIRREGSAAYEIADTGEHSPFLAHVYSLSVSAPRRDGAVVKADFSLVCTKGVIPRALVDSLGDALGCGASLESLRRTKVGKFSVDAAIAFDRLLQTDMRDFAPCVTPTAKALL